MTVIDIDELAVRIAEACTGVVRPAGMSGVAGMIEIGRADPESAKGFKSAAVAAANYIAECCDADAKTVFHDSPGGVS